MFLTQIQETITTVVSNMKSFLALKGVSNEYQSAFADGKFRRTYKVGGDHRFHPRLPAYIIGPDLERLEWDGLHTGTDDNIKRILLLRVPQTRLTKMVPFFNGVGVNSDEYNDKTFAQIVQENSQNYEFDFLGATRFTVIEEVDQNQFQNPHEAMLHFEKKYSLPRVKHNSVLSC